MTTLADSDPASSDPVVRAFESGTIEPSRFGHREHLYVGFRYLRAMSLEDAVARFVRNLRNLADALGVPGKVHITMTWAYLVLLDDAMHRAPPDTTFDELLAASPALLDHRAGALFDHYERAELDSEEARRRFVLPRRR